MKRFHLWIFTLSLACPTACSAAELLFIRGADRSGGFLEAGNDDARTEQLSDLFNTSTSGGNHGWAELRSSLLSAGFGVTQITETAENASGPSAGIAVDLTTVNLTQYDAVVFGSNNAPYSTASVDALESYVRSGGGALFISDANFGGDWADASDSDQPFLDRFGLVAHQDQGTYQLSRSAGDFLAPDHPVLSGVDAIDGEGVTPIRVENPEAFGVDVTILALAEGQTRLNEPPFGNNQQGPSRSAGPNDAAVLVGTAGAGRIAGHFDRNTFFNLNGAGTNINRFDNEQYALNLFGWLAGQLAAGPGDYNADGEIDNRDYDVWVNAFGTTGASPTPGDGNLDGAVNAADYTVWRDALAASVTETIPEPSTAMLLLSLIVAQATRRRAFVQNSC